MKLLSLRPIVSITLFCMCLLCIQGYAQINKLHEDHDHAEAEMYTWDIKKDGFIIFASGAMWGGSHVLKNNADKINTQDLMTLDRNNVWAFDRGATKNYSKSADKVSDYMLFTMPILPFLHYFEGRCWHEGEAVVGMLVETFFLTDGVVNMLKAAAKRFRPFTYNPDVPNNEKLTRGSRYSFVSGHTSTTAAMGFFSAQVFSDFHPDSRLNPYIWGAAATIPAVTGLLRYKAGKHFPTDIIGGYAVGMAFGILVPRLHKMKHESISLDLLPMPGGMGVSFRKILGQKKMRASPENGDWIQPLSPY